MDRLETVRQVIDEILRGQPNPEESRCGFVHLYGVSGTCALLAMKRGLDPQICALMGMLHDIATYKTGDPKDHAQRSALEAQEILNITGGYTQEEIAEVCNAIARHSAKDVTDGALAELLKDADVFQHYLYNPALIKDEEPHWEERLKSVLGELAIDSL